MKLGGELRKNRKYLLSIKFKIRTDSNMINFHIKDSGSNLYQVILSEDVSGKNNGLTWIEKSVEFVANANIYDEFMIAASLIRGENNFIAFSYINIKSI